MSAPAKKSMEQLVDALRQKKGQLRQGGGPDRQAKQKEQGKRQPRLEDENPQSGTHAAKPPPNPSESMIDPCDA